MSVFLVEFVFFSVLPSFQPLVFFLIQNAPSPFCSLGFGTLGGPRRIYMLCLVVGLAQRPTGNSAAVVRACWFVIIIFLKKTYPWGGCWCV